MLTASLKVTDPLPETQPPLSLPCSLVCCFAQAPLSQKSPLLGRTAGSSALEMFAVSAALRREVRPTREQNRGKRPLGRRLDEKAVPSPIAGTAQVKHGAPSRRELAAGLHSSASLWGCVSSPL